MITGDISDLGLMQLADSFFPTGLYTMSHGLEVLYLQKHVIGQEQIRELIEMYFLQQVGPADCVALANAYSFAEQGNMDGIFKVDDTIHKLKLVKSQRDASTRSGKQLIKCVTSFLKDESLTKYSLAVQSSHTPGTYPVSFALSAKSFGIPKRQACLMLFYGFAVSIVGAALRLGILQHFESQQILDEIKPTISKTIDKYITKYYEQMWQFAPQADIIQIHHEKMYSKMFIT